MSRPAGDRFLLALILLPVFLVSAPAVAAPRILKVRVVDRSGHGLPGASVFLLVNGVGAPRASLDTPPWSDRAAVVPAVFEPATTGADGTVETSLPPGRYRVAASKSGYGIGVADVSTLLRSRLEIRLEDLVRAVTGDLPLASEPDGLGLDWILRTPADDVLRETEARASQPAGEDAASPAGGSRLGEILETLDGELVQHFSGEDLPGQDSAGGGSSGRSTSLALRGSLGDQGAWRFHGLTGRQENGLLDGFGGARQDRRAERLQIGLDYRLGRGNLKSDVRYGTNRYVVDPSGDTVNATDQDQTDLGMETRWDRPLGGTAILYVEGAYTQTSVRAVDAGLSPFAVTAAESPDARRVLDRSTLATAGVAFDAGDHHFDLGMRAKSYRYDLRNQGVLLYSLYDTPSLAEPGERGNAMSIFGSDDWRMAPGATLNYGLRYHSNINAGQAYLVPRVGVTFQRAPGGATLRALALYRLDDPGLVSLYARSDDPADAMARDVGRFGYLLSLEHRSDDRLEMAATISYKPFEEGVGEDDTGLLAPGAWGDALLFLTDGAAGRHELGLEVGRVFGGLHGVLSGTVGRVDGRLSPAIEEAPVQRLSVGEVRYTLTRLKAMYAPTATEVQVDYRRVDASSADTAEGRDPEGLDYRRIDLTVSQDLPRLRNIMNARFRVLMAYQGLAYGASTMAVAPAITTRWTGGVDIRF
ncbi:MAG TPA: TonB-dependent receptor [Candidatus Polarisedimenticolia bacterium]